jgi:hypothetical protein
MYQQYVSVLIPGKINKPLRQLFFAFGPILGSVDTEWDVVLRVIITEHIEPCRLRDLPIEHGHTGGPHLSFCDIGVMVPGGHYKGHSRRYSGFPPDAAALGCRAIDRVIAGAQHHRRLGRSCQPRDELCHGLIAVQVRETHDHRFIRSWLRQGIELS